MEPGLDSPTKTETIPITAHTNRSQLTEFVLFSFENKNMNVSKPAVISRMEGSALTITAYSWSDYIMNIMNALHSPISVLVPPAGVIGGIITWFLKRETDKKRIHKAGINSTNSDSGNNNKV
jgi:hypothetical protein